MPIALVVPLIVVVVVVGVVGFLIIGFNKLRTTDIGAQEALGGIDVQLTRRADLIPNLVEAVQGYAAHEKGVFEEVTSARASVKAAAAGDDPEAKAVADAALGDALVKVNAVAEAYPELKANENFRALQQQLVDSENQLSFARQYYNDAVATLNKLTQTIPWMFLTGLAQVRQRKFYDAPEGTDQVPRVRF
jgi:LemA protein